MFHFLFLFHLEQMRAASSLNKKGRAHVTHGRTVELQIARQVFAMKLPRNPRIVHTLSIDPLHDHQLVLKLVGTMPQIPEASKCQSSKQEDNNN